MDFFEWRKKKGHRGIRTSGNLVFGHTHRRKRIITKRFVLNCSIMHALWYEGKFSQILNYYWLQITHFLWRMFQKCVFFTNWKLLISLTVLQWVPRYTTCCSLLSTICGLVVVWFLAFSHLVCVWWIEICEFVSISALFVNLQEIKKTLVWRTNCPTYYIVIGMWLLLRVWEVFGGKFKDLFQVCV